MKYGSVCSGIEAATVAWHPLGWEAMWYSQYDPEWNYNKRGPDFPSRVLAHYYPDVPNLGDMCSITDKPEFNDTAIDVLVGGTPCQSFSIAGLRKGLDDERGNLSLEFVRLLMRKRPRWFVWENVPGVLNSQSGDADEEQDEAETTATSSDFACILSAFTGRDIGNQKFTKGGIIEGEFYSIAWRILDSQYFGVPQRRRRIFVVGHLGNDWRPPAAVLFERESLRRDFTPKREAGQSVTGTTETGTGNNSEQRTFDKQRLGEYSENNVASTVARRDFKGATDLVVVPFTAGGFADNLQSQQSSTLKKAGHDLGGGSETLVCIPINTMTVQGRPSDDGRMGLGIGENGDVQNTITKNHSHAVAYGIQANIINRQDQNGGNGKGVKLEQAPTLTKADQHAVAHIFKEREGKEGGGKGYMGQDEKTYTISTRPDQSVMHPIRYGEHQQDTMHFESGIMSTLPKGTHNNTNTYTNVMVGMMVRRLTPLECERLQGFPDNYTLIPDETSGKYKDPANATDSNRYAAIGNSMTTTVMKWIGMRIQKVTDILIELGR